MCLATVVMVGNAPTHYRLFTGCFCYYLLLTVVTMLFFKKMCQPWPLLSFIFGVFEQTSLQFLKQIYVKHVLLVYGARIQSHDLWNLESPPITTRGSRPTRLFSIGFE